MRGTGGVPPGGGETAKNPEGRSKTATPPSKKKQLSHGGSYTWGVGLPKRDMRVVFYISLLQDRQILVERGVAQTWALPFFVPCVSKIVTLVTVLCRLVYWFTVM